MLRVESGNTKEFSGPFAIAGGDDRRVHIGKAALAEETMDGKGEGAAQAEDRADARGYRG